MGALRPDRLELGDHPFVQTFATMLGDPAGMTGLAVPFALGLLGGALFWARARRRRPGPRTPLARALLPDYAPLLPETRRERLWFVAVSLSAGVCEEIVFRGWLLAFLHAACGLRGSALVATAALAFGLAHLYQGGLPVLTTACLGAVLCILYAATGSLVLPVVLHTLIDLRCAFLPRPGGRRIGASAAGPTTRWCRRTPHARSSRPGR
jgi:membrane protease YdiL (CAAX protease family)